MSKEHLRPFNTLPEDERKRIARMGAAAAVEARKRKKLMREQADALLAASVKSKKGLSNLQRLGALTDDADNQLAILAGIVLKGISGDLECATFLRDLVGEKPRDEKAVEHSGGFTFGFDSLPAKTTEDEISG